MGATGIEKWCTWELGGDERLVVGGTERWLVWRFDRYRDMVCFSNCVLEDLCVWLLEVQGDCDPAN